jgi:RNA polymerase sigma-70 factor (ECF subfamily)
MATDTTPIEPDVTELTRDYRDTIWRYLRFLGCSPELADDLAQETFMAVLEHPFEERNPRATRAWLRTTARNLYLMTLRDKDHNLVLQNPQIAESVWAQFEKDDGGNSALDALRSCLEKLNGKARQAVQLQYRERRSRVDIADILDMKPDGVKTLLRRTRQTLKNCIQRKVES